jgi:hypothetical protein
MKQCSCDDATSGFDLKQLVKVAEQAAGNNAACVNITKLPEGNFNKALLATMRDGR